MNKFLLELSSDLDYDGMVVEISYDKQTVARLNYDKGIDRIEIEIITNIENSIPLIFPLQDFLEILEKAKKLILKCAEEDRHR